MPTPTGTTTPESATPGPASEALGAPSTGAQPPSTSPPAPTPLKTMRVSEAMHRNVVTIAGHQSLPEAVVLMETLQVRRLPVILQGRLVGLITAQDVRRRLPGLHEGLTPWDFVYRAGRVSVAEAMCTTVLTAGADDPLLRAVQTLLDRRIGGMPVLDDEQRLVGLMSLTDVLRAALANPEPGWGAVREHMSGAIQVTAGTPASDAAARLKVTRLRVLPVVEGHHLVGVIHERDLQAAVERGEAARGHGETVLADRFFLQGLTAGDLMRPPSGVVLASVPLQAAIGQMLEADVHGLPVVTDGGRLLGVLTVSDVLRALVGQGGSAGTPG